MSTPGEELRLSEYKFTKRSCGFFYWCPQKGCQRGWWHTCSRLQQSAWTLVHIQIYLWMEGKKRGRTGGRNGVEGKILLPSHDKGAERHHVSFLQSALPPWSLFLQGTPEDFSISSIPEVLSTERSYKWNLLTPPSPPIGAIRPVSLRRGPACR